MAGGINTGNHPKALWPGIKRHFGQVYDKLPTQYADLFNTVTSDKAYEEYVEVIRMGYAAIKAEGASIAFDADRQGYVARLTNVTYALGYQVTMEEMDDNQYAELSKRRSGYLAFSMAQTKEVVGANIYNRAFDPNYTGGDGKELLATDHPSLSGSQSNELAVAADFSEASLEDMLIQIMQSTDNRGLRINLRGESLHVHPANAFNATRVLKSVQQSGTANNDVNAVREMGLLPKGVKVNQYFTDTDAWFVRTMLPNGSGPIHQQRKKLVFDKDNDFHTKNALASAIERYTFGWDDWRGVFGSAGA